jgi:hypothetical protein
MNDDGSLVRMEEDWMMHVTSEEGEVANDEEEVDLISMEIVVGCSDH